MSKRFGKQTARSQAWKPKPGKQRSRMPQKLIVPVEPPSVNPSPWTPLIVARIVSFGSENFSSGLVQGTDIGNWIYDQLDPGGRYFVKNTEKAPVYFKIESVMAWNLTGKTLALTVNDFTTNDVTQYTVKDEDYEFLGSWFDSVSGNTPPRCGYRWPSGNRNKVLSNHKRHDTGFGEGLRHLFTILAPKDDQLMIHVKLFWRFPATGAEMLRTLIGASEIHRAIRDCDAANQEKLQQLSDRAVESLKLQRQTYRAMPNKILGNVPVWVANKILPTTDTVHEYDVITHDDIPENVNAVHVRQQLAKIMVSEDQNRATDT